MISLRRSIQLGDEVSLRLTSLDISVCDIIRDNEHLITALHLQIEELRPTPRGGWIGKLQNALRKLYTNDIDSLFHLPVLERLTLTNAMIQGPNFTVYMGLQFPLQELRLVQCSLTQQALNRIAKLPHLASLSLEDCPDVNDIEPLQTSQSLRFLSVENSPVPSQQTNRLKAMHPHITVVDKVGLVLGVVSLDASQLSDVIPLIGGWLAPPVAFNRPQPRISDLIALMCTNKAFAAQLRPLRETFYRHFKGVLEESREIFDGFSRPTIKVVRNEEYDQLSICLRRAQEDNFTLAIKMWNFRGVGIDRLFWPNLVLIGKLELARCDVTDEIVAKLSNAQNLQELILNGHIDPDPWRSYHRVPMKTNLYDVSPLAKLLHLRRLSLEYQPHLWAHKLAELVHAPALQVLSLEGSHLKFPGDYPAPGRPVDLVLQGFAQSTTLKTLNFRGVASAHHVLEGLAHMTTLTHLRAGLFGWVREEDPAPSCVPSSLRSLEIGYQREIKDMTFLTGCYNLRHLSVKSRSKEPVDFSFLSYFTTLSSLEIKNRDYSRFDSYLSSLVQDLSKLSSLTKLRLNISNMNGESFNLQQMAPLGFLTGLRTVMIHHYNYNKNFNLDVFEQLPALMYLGLPHASEWFDRSVPSHVTQVLEAFRNKRPEVIVSFLEK
ncbi:MAG: hypothetical protein ACK5O7_00430 [Holosporales bacterium]